MSENTALMHAGSEHSAFGVASDGTLKANKAAKTLNVKETLLRAGPVGGVVDLANLQVELTTSGSAELATEMIRKPEQQSITWIQES